MKRFILTIVATGLVFSASVFPVRAAHLGEKVTVNVMGLVCDFCAQAVKKVFMNTGRVDHVEVDLDKALISLSMKPGEVMKDEEITALIVDSGYAVDRIGHDAGEGHE